MTDVVTHIPMTEERHKTLWCPFRVSAATYTRSDDAETHTDVIGFNPENCIGSACSQWRWWSLEQKDGFCGLGGKPLIR